MDYKGNFIAHSRWAWTRDFVPPKEPPLGAACFAAAPRNKKAEHKYFWFYLATKEIGEQNYPILSSYFKDVLRLFPKACMVVPSPDPNHLVFVLNFDDYVWEPSEFLACCTLLRNPGEFPRDVLGYTPFRKWGCSISQAILLSQYYFPDTMKDWTMNGAPIEKFYRPFSGHSFAVAGTPTTLVGYSIPDITKAIRANKKNIVFNGMWKVQRTYGAYKINELKRAEFFISEAEVKALLEEPAADKPKQRKRNAGDYVL